MLFFLHSGFPHFVKLAALKIPIIYDGFHKRYTLFALSLKCRTCKTREILCKKLKYLLNFYHTKRQSTDGFTKTLNGFLLFGQKRSTCKTREIFHGLLLSAKNAARARLGKPFIEDLTIFVPGQTS